MTKFIVFSDFACPFCYIGFTIAKRITEEMPDVEFKWYPYELDRNVPPEGASLEESIPRDKIDFSFKRIERLGSEYGLIYNNKLMKFNTGLLHRAALYAQETGHFYAFANEAFRQIFEEGKNVALKEVVNDIGFKAGLSIHEMMSLVEDGSFEDAIEEARELSIIHEIDSVPTFIREDGKVITLLKNYEKFKNDLLT
ncbi:MAG: DsbA family protein [Gudongella sp.]|jgi:predicted DsbA family dithiol-disulfide isomerase|nr:DsbA family protein [Gudongella sp.]